MSQLRQAAGSLVLIGVFLVVDAPRLWLYVVPAATSVLASRVIAPVSFSFTVVALTLLGPGMTLALLFLIAGGGYPDTAAEHLRAGLDSGELAGIAAAPFVGAAVWLVLSYLTRRSSGPLARPLN